MLRSVTLLPLPKWLFPLKAPGNLSPRSVGTAESYQSLWATCIYMLQLCCTDRETEARTEWLGLSSRPEGSFQKQSLILWIPGYVLLVWKLGGLGERERLLNWSLKQFSWKMYVEVTNVTSPLKGVLASLGPAGGYLTLTTVQTFLAGRQGPGC